MKRKFTNEILEDHGTWLEIDISTPKYQDATMLVDADVFERHKGGRICAAKLGKSKFICGIYRVENKNYYFHRDVIDLTGGLEVDHITHPTMTFIDNRKQNLRAATSSQNGMNRGLSSNNSSGFTGVCWYKRSSKWKATITVDKKTKNLGQFETMEDAVAARKIAQDELFGEYAFVAPARPPK